MIAVLNVVNAAIVGYNLWCLASQRWYTPVVAMRLFAIGASAFALSLQ